MSELPSHDHILKEVGGALSNWSLVEIQLAGFFNAMSDIPPQVIDGAQKATALFDTIRDFPARLAVCDTLMRYESVDDLERDMWFRLSELLTKGYSQRHRLAHFSIDYDRQGQPVITPFLTTSKVFAEDKPQLSLATVKERSNHFLNLHMAVGWFGNQAFRRRLREVDHLPKNEEPMLVPQLRRSAIQSRADKKREARSSAE